MVWIMQCSEICSDVQWCVCAGICVCLIWSRQENKSSVNVVMRWKSNGDC